MTTLPPRVHPNVLRSQTALAGDRTLNTLARGDDAVVVRFDDNGSGLDQGGHRLVVGDRLRVRRHGDPMIVELVRASGRVVRLGLCVRTARGIVVGAPAPAGTSARCG